MRASTRSWAMPLWMSCGVSRSTVMLVVPGKEGEAESVGVFDAAKTRAAHDAAAEDIDDQAKAEICPLLRPDKFLMSQLRTRFGAVASSAFSVSLVSLAGDITTAVIMDADSSLALLTKLQVERCLAHIGKESCRPNEV